MPEPQATEFVHDGLHWTDATVWQQFCALAADAPEAAALIAADGRTWTRAEILRMAHGAAAALQSNGVQAGDRVMLQGRKNAPTVAAALGIAATGAIVCPFTPDLGAAECRVLDERLNHYAVVGDRDGDALAAVPGLRIARRDRALLAARDPRDAHTALIGFTSGTTGIPKAVMHSPAALNYTVRACQRIAGLAPGDAILGVVPLGSAPGYTFTLHFSMALGHPLVIIDPWDALHTLEAIDAHRCRWGICVPTHLASLIEVARSGKWMRPSPIKALGVGGSSMTPELIRDAQSLLGISALRMFGMSECMGHASTLPGDSEARRMHSDGKSFPGTSDEAFDSEQRLLPRGERGQAGVRGPSLFLGYCRGLGDQEFQLTADGYFLTGDEVVCDADGYLKVVGRIKDQIIRGGYNVDPAEVEAVLLRHPAIAKAAVVAVPEKRLGEQACAVCCVRDGLVTPDLAQIKDHLLAAGLSKKKWPEHLLIVEDLAYTATGKVDKKALARLAATTLGLG